jgi:PAS domain S-box-containing protein
LTDQVAARRAGAAGRAKGEIARARDLRLGTGQALLAGLFIAWLAIAIKASLNEIVGGNTGYIVLTAAAVLAAWIGGITGGLTAVAVAVVLNHVAFLAGQPISPTSQFVQGLYVVVGTAIVFAVASRRASRDRLEDALAEVAALAEDVETRDERLELMLSASGTGFWEWDVESGALTWSDAIFRQHGLEPAPEAPGFVAYLDMIHPDDRAAFESAIGSTVEGGADTFELDFRIVWPDGSVHWTHGAGRLFRDETGRPVRMIGTGQDITERRRILEDRDRLLDDERRAGAFREAFVDVISHELRTPITTIMGLAQILARPGRADDESSRMALLEDVRSEAERLHRLVEDLLVLSRVERGRLEVEAEPIEPRRLLDRIVSHEARELPTIEVETDLEPDLPIVAGESTYVEQIVRNLLNNAAKYTPAGTRVSVSARKVEGHGRDPRHRRRAGHPGDVHRPRSSSSSTATPRVRGSWPAQASGSSSVPASSRRWGAGSGPLVSRRAAPRSGSACASWNPTHTTPTSAISCPVCPRSRRNRRCRSRAPIGSPVSTTTDPPSGRTNQPCWGRTRRRPSARDRRPPDRRDACRG